MSAKVSMIAAIGRGRELGIRNRLLWRIPDDLKRFKSITKGHPIIMGRKTFESIGRPLPERTNIVLTKDLEWSAEGVHARHSIREALEYAKSLNEEEVFVIGGAEIYAQALPHTDKLYLTLVEDENKEADAHFPPFEEIFSKKTFEEEREWEGIRYRWVDLER